VYDHTRFCKVIQVKYSSPSGVFGAKIGRFVYIGMKRIAVCLVIMFVLASCQRELYFPAVPATPTEITIAAIVVTNPTQNDYDSIVFRYQDAIIKEVHYSTAKDSLTRTYTYDAAGRLVGIKDQKPIYYTNNNSARSIVFQYNAAGELQQTSTDFVNVAGLKAQVVIKDRQMILYDTAYSNAAFNLDWANRIVYSTRNNKDYLLYDSCIYMNTSTPGLDKTVVSVYHYIADSIVNSVDKRIYFNQELSEYGTMNVFSDHPAPVWQAMRKRLFGNLANWFDAGAAWQDDNFHWYPLPGGPYKSIDYIGNTLSSGLVTPPYTRNFEYDNSFENGQLSRSVITYTLQGQGTGHYIYILRIYYNK
jgi:hypothetical protein